jgi:hypothetical protein
MLTGDAFKVDTHALVAHMETDTRYTPDERAFLVVYHASLNAGASTRQQDSMFVNCLKKFICQNPNY